MKSFTSLSHSKSLGTLLLGALLTLFSVHCNRDPLSRLSDRVERIAEQGLKERSVWMIKVQDKSIAMGVGPQDVAFLKFMKRRDGLDIPLTKAFDCPRDPKEVIADVKKRVALVRQSSKNSMGLMILGPLVEELQGILEVDIDWYERPERLQAYPTSRPFKEADAEALATLKKVAIDLKPFVKELASINQELVAIANQQGLFPKEKD